MPELHHIIAVSETCIVYKTLIMHKIGVFNRISKDVWFIYADNGFPRGLTNEHILAVWTEPHMLDMTESSTTMELYRYYSATVKIHSVRSKELLLEENVPIFYDLI